MGSIVKTTKTTTTDLKTGENKTEEKEQIIKYPKTEDFVMTFTKQLGFMKHLSKGQILLMFAFLQKVNRDNEVVLNKGIKEEIAEEFGLKVNSIDPMITKLKEKGMIHPKVTEDGKTRRGIYLLNTFFFGKGNWVDIKKMRMYIEWDFKEQVQKIAIEQETLSEEEILEKQILKQQKHLENLKKKKQESNNQKYMEFE